MSKQKLTEMVLQKIHQKKKLEQQNRPHHQLLQLRMKFSLEQNSNLKEEVSSLLMIKKQQKQRLSFLKQSLQQLQNTGKKTYPIIIVKPQFIASQNITTDVKQFYRKASNTYLKNDILKQQNYQKQLQIEKNIISLTNQINQQQIFLADIITKNIKIIQEKRYSLLKEDIKKRLIIHQQNIIEYQMQKLRSDNQILLKQYQIKKQNLEDRILYCQNLEIKIALQKTKIQEKYNPITYREYLKEVFQVRFKNQVMEKNLQKIIKSLNQTKDITRNFKDKLLSKCSVNFIGKIADSPSKFKGKIQKNLLKDETKKSQTNPKTLTQIIDCKSTTNHKISKSKKSKSTFQEDLSGSRCFKLMKNKGKNSERNYSSMKILQNLKKSIKTERTLSTTLANSSANKFFRDF